MSLFGVRGPWAAILAGGVASGFLDIAYACARVGFNGAPPSRAVQAVASGLIGRAAFDGGAATVLLGLALHFAMTIAMAAIFVGAAARSSWLRAYPLPAGVAYGAAIYLVMNRVVVPLSAFPGPPFTLNLSGLLVHIFLVGLPIALAAKYLATVEAPPNLPTGKAEGLARNPSAEGR